jgi:hypothetical protein
MLDLQLKLVLIAKTHQLHSFGYISNYGSSAQGSKAIVNKKKWTSYEQSVQVESLE